MISITLFFEIYNLFFAKLPVLFSTVLAIVIIATSTSLYAWSLKTLRLAKDLPEEKFIDVAKRRKLRKAFLIVIIIEITGFNIAPFVLLYFNQIAYVVPIEILICAIHFIPLASIFKMPVYYWLGGIVALITIITILFVPTTSQLGNLRAVSAIPSLGFIISNLIIIIYVLNDAMKYIGKNARISMS